MSTSSQPASTETVHLDVSSDDRASEIFVINSRLALAARGIGSMGADLEPGIYKVKVRTGPTTREQTVVLQDANTPVRVEVGSLSFHSPAPIPTTDLDNPELRAAAAREAGRVHVAHGHGASIFVYASDTASHPISGLSLLNARGTPVANLDRHAASGGHADLSWAACTVAVDPGLYRFSLAVDKHTRLEQTIVASPGWQTQVFLRRRPYGTRAKHRLPNLSGAAVFVQRDGVCDLTRPDVRLTELGRLGLRAERRVLLPELIAGQLDSPMLGIYAGHLLLLEDQPDLNQLRGLVDALRTLVGDGHPDVEALALAAQPGATPQIEFRIPPMLRRSWALIVNATAAHPGLVPSDSLAAAVALRTWAEEPWLLWTRYTTERAADLSPRSDTPSPAEEVASVSALLHKYLHRSRRPGPEAPAHALAGPGAAMAGVASDLAPSVSQDLAEPARSVEPSSGPADEATLRRLVRVTGVPRATLDQMITQLQQQA
jgi:hypothetical protein